MSASGIDAYGLLMLVGVYIAAPLAAAIFFTWFDWRASIKGYLIWMVLLFVGWAFVTGFKINDTLFGFFLYGMFFSVPATIVFAWIVKIWRHIKAWREARSAHPECEA